MCLNLRVGVGWSVGEGRRDRIFFLKERRNTGKTKHYMPPEMRFSIDSLGGAEVTTYFSGTLGGSVTSRGYIWYVLDGPSCDPSLCVCLRAQKVAAQEQWVGRS